MTYIWQALTAEEKRKVFFLSGAKDTKETIVGILREYLKNIPDPFMRIVP